MNKPIDDDDNNVLSKCKDKTSLISKLNSKEEIQTNLNNVENFKNTLEKTTEKISYMDKSSIGIYKTQNKPYDSVMKNLAERIRQ